MIGGGSASVFEGRLLPAKTTTRAKIVQLRMVSDGMVVVQTDKHVLRGLGGLSECRACLVEYLVLETCHPELTMETPAALKTMTAESVISPSASASPGWAPGGPRVSGGAEVCASDTHSVADLHATIALSATNLTTRAPQVETVRAQDVTAGEEHLGGLAWWRSRHEDPVALKLCL